MTSRALVTLTALLLYGGAAAAQRVRDWSAQAIPALTETNVVPGNRSLGELRVVQPVGMLEVSGAGDRVRLVATVDFEKYTITHGELAPGDWGEGFEDRRHPHTLVHQLMLVVPDLSGRLLGPVRLFAAAGKGFVPFGTDDPMSRPVVRYPVNHHLSQILERAVGLAGVRAGPVTLEGALFNGDEPVSPGSWPAISRFGDSWATRLTVTPLPGLEAQASYAFVHSPENRPGAGPDDAKTSASARWERGPWYGLVEWAHTRTAGGAFVFRSVLAEGALQLPRQRPYVRFERSDRPEEERLFASPFRTRRPLFENSILGITCWTVLTAGDAVEVWTGRRVRIAPFVEGSYLGIARVGGGVFDPQIWYGRTRGFTITVGARLASGMRMSRMGRYYVQSMQEMSMP
ncbi:MAG TPA: hypothetical protein VL563_14035 [Gemmatimonadales bacterium]|nr:hypothetical protein [Gemmatimonadales bacterium]